MGGGRFNPPPPSLAGLYIEGYRDESISSLVKPLRVCVRGKSSGRSYGHALTHHDTPLYNPASLATSLSWQVRVYFL